MALQLRRGSDAERIAITFAEGELVYTTDTKKIWIGDGVTAGGVNVTAEVELSPSQLDKNLSLNNFTINGAGTIDITGDITTTGNLSVTGNITDVVDITITGNFSTTRSITSVVDVTASGTISGNLSGDGSLITNLPIDGNAYQIDVKAKDNSVIVDSTTKTFNGTFVGDGSGLTNLPIQPGGFVNGATYNLTVSANDATILVNSATKEFKTQNLTIANSQIINSSSNEVEIIQSTNDPNAVLSLHIPADGSFRLNSYNGTFASKEDTIPGELLNNLRFSGYNGGSYRILGGIISQWDNSANFLDQYPAGKVGIYAGGNGSVINFASFSGSTGTFESPIIKTGSYANAADRNAKITKPEAGMIILLANDGSGNAKFQGYTGEAWVNLN